MSSVMLYNVNATYDQNCKDGPQYNREIPERLQSNETFDFVGFEVDSQAVVPAGPLLDAGFVERAFEFCSVNTYKTIRSREQEVNGFPNVCYLKTEMFVPGNPPAVLTTRSEAPEDPSMIAITNSFGMPSKGPDFLREDIPKALACAKKGQVLVVSVVGDDTADFVKTALLAKECGAKVIEANFSCPNVCTHNGQLYLDDNSVREVSRAMVQALGDTPLIIKLGVFKEKADMEKTIRAAAESGVRGICGINTVAVEVRDPNGNLALGPKRVKSGVCGFPIRETALAFTRDAREIINRIHKEMNIKLTLIAGGGITEAKHFDEFINAGADFAFSGAGFLRRPEIFIEWHNSRIVNKNNKE